EDKIDLAKSYIEKAKEKGVQFYIQTDAVVADAFKEDANHKNVNVDAIEKGWMVLDIGPETAKVYRDVIKNSKLIVWKDRKSTRLNSSHVSISYAVFCLKKKKTKTQVL